MGFVVSGTAVNIRRRCRVNAIGRNESGRPGRSDDDICKVSGCIEEIRSELHLYSTLTAAPVKKKRHPRTTGRLVEKAQLTVLATYSPASLSFQRVKSEFFNICQRHPDVKFLMIEAEKFPEIVRKQLHVRSVPTFILFRNGERIDHFDARDRKTMEQIIEDNS
mmetsp:Transcript_14040/g.56563  ORF Transcript_14040/g.56563 Transcript_14040/m.56563 type:complete len:164 (-) Transcript_14040:343-834(-)